MDETTIEKLKADNPGSDLHVIKIAGETVVIRPPSSGEFERFVSNMERESRAKALGALLFSVRVYPSSEALQSILDKKAGLVFSIGNEVCKIAGLNQEAETSKL